MPIKKTWTCVLLFFLSCFAAYSQNDSIPNGARENKQAKMYCFKPVIDIPVIVTGCAWSAFAFPKIYSKDPSTEQEILNLDKSNIPSFDRWAAGKINEAADKNSDYLLYGSLPVPFALFIDKDIRQDAGRVSLMYLEAFAITGLIYSGSVYFVDRYRPATYNTSIPASDRTSGNNKDAFIAGHPATVATATFFTAKVYSDYHPESNFKYVLYGVAIAATGTTAYMRHIAGKHFPSDLLCGVTVGTLSGILVPHFHKNKVIKDRSLGLLPFTNGKSHGIYLTYKLK